MNEKIKIVLADDNKDFCQLLKEYLSNEEDIEILGIAKDGIEALDLVQKTQPDLLVLDVIMPHLDGLGVIEKLNSMDLNEIFISGMRAYDMAVRLKIANLPVEKFLIKEDFEGLTEAIKNSKENKVYIFATYTAMINYRKYLHSKGYIDKLW